MYQNYHRRKKMEKIQSDGAIYINDFKSKSTQPDWTGKVELSTELLKQLVTKVKENEKAELRIALWDRTSKQDKEYKYARLDVPVEQKKDETVETKVVDTPMDEFAVEEVAEPNKKQDDYEDKIPF